MKFKENNQKIWMENEEGKVIAEIDFPETGENTVTITHTEVDPSLGGQGIAGKLTEAAAQKIKASGKKAELSCSYAIKWFGKHEEYREILADAEAEGKKAEELAGPACDIKR